MAATAGHLLGIYETRCDMQRCGITDPPLYVKQFCERFVVALRAIDPATDVEIVDRVSEGTDFIAAGQVLATLPAGTAAA